MPPESIIALLFTIELTDFHYLTYFKKHFAPSRVCNEPEKFPATA